MTYSSRAPLSTTTASAVIANNFNPGHIELPLLSWLIVVYFQVAVYFFYIFTKDKIVKSTAVEQAVACASVTQLPGLDHRSGQVSWVRFFRGFGSPVRQMSGKLRPQLSPDYNWPISARIIHYGRQWPEMLTRPKTQIKIIIKAWLYHLLPLCKGYLNSNITWQLRVFLSFITCWMEALNV